MTSETQEGEGSGGAAALPDLAAPREPTALAADANSFQPVKGDKKKKKGKRGKGGEEKEGDDVLGDAEEWAKLDKAAANFEADEKEKARAKEEETALNKSRSVRDRVRDRYWVPLLLLYPLPLAFLLSVNVFVGNILINWASSRCQQDLRGFTRVTVGYAYVFLFFYSWMWIGPLPPKRLRVLVIGYGLLTLIGFLIWGVVGTYMAANVTSSGFQSCLSVSPSLYHYTRFQVALFWLLSLCYGAFLFYEVQKFYLRKVGRATYPGDEDLKTEHLAALAAEEGAKYDSSHFDKEKLKEGSKKEEEELSSSGLKNQEDQKDRKEKESEKKKKTGPDAEDDDEEEEGEDGDGDDSEEREEGDDADSEEEPEDKLQKKGEKTTSSPKAGEASSTEGRGDIKPPEKPVPQTTNDTKPVETGAPPSAGGTATAAPSIPSGTGSEEEPQKSKETAPAPDSAARISAAGSGGESLKEEAKK